MTDRFLLYIDILGFSEMTRKDPRKVARVYAILNQLNSHHNDSFKTIVFSDTVLVYNVKPAEGDPDREDYVWYLTEFAEHLHHMLTGQDIYFRAALVAGDFFHYRLDNVECFFGGALIDAYNAEKDIPSLGLFMDATCVRYNRFFRLASFNDKFSFVYLNRHLEYLNQRCNGQYPAILGLLEDSPAPFLPWQVRFLQDIHFQMRNHPSPHVRTKFLTAWDFHYKRYPEMLQTLLQHDFSLNALAYPGAWNAEASALEKHIKYYKRIGSGTDLSMTISGKKSKSSKLPVTQSRKSALKAGEDSSSPMRPPPSRKL
ncbi:hypothetical protein [Pseudomonas sp. yb_9]|uniref:hypothetical protein n=1 Tax=Pseudomonas sp. yb_9 TaxID=3367222 RepID=UPI00370B2FA4